MVMLIMTTTIMATPAGVTLDLSPKSSGVEDVRRVDIKVTAENVIYVDDRVMTLNEMRRWLAQPKYRGGLITVRSDKRASVGRIMDIMSICKGISQGQVHVTSLE